MSIEWVKVEPKATFDHFDKFESLLFYVNGVIFWGSWDGHYFVGDEWAADNVDEVRFIRDQVSHYALLTPPTN